MALAVDQLLALVENGLRQRNRLRAMLGGAGIAALVAVTLVPSMARSPSNYVVGAKTFTEQYVLSALIAQRLRAAGFSATSREGLGSNVIFEALKSNDIDAYVDYSGTLWANQFHRTDIKPREELLGELKAMLAEQEITLLGELGFENAYALVMPKKRAAALGIHSIADLAAHAPTMSLAADYEFFSRPEWASLQKAYGLSFRAQRQMQPDFMYAAAASGEVDVIAGYTSDGLIAKYDLVALEDSRHAIPPYDAIVLLSPRRAGDQALQAAHQTAARQDRYSGHARGEPARRRRRRCVIAGRGGALAVGKNREALRRIHAPGPCAKDALSLTRRDAAIDTGISARGRHGQPAQVMRPTLVVVGALNLVRKTAMGHAQQSAAVPVDKIDLDQARSRWHLLPSLPTEAVGEAVDRHDLPERAARHVSAGADALDEIEPARMRLSRRLGAHPAHDIFRIGQEGENRRRRGCDLDLASNHERISHQCLPGADRGVKANCRRIARDKGGVSNS